MTKATWSRLAREFGFFLFYGVVAFVCAYAAFVWCIASMSWANASAGMFINSKEIYYHWWHYDAVNFVEFFLTIAVARWLIMGLAKLVLRSLSARQSASIND